jgi:hypothetical protein
MSEHYHKINIISVVISQDQDLLLKIKTAFQLEPGPGLFSQGCLSHQPGKSEKSKAVGSSQMNRNQRLALLVE